MEELDAVAITTGGGLDGDHKGLRFPRRGVTLIEREAWEAAIAELADLAGPVPLAWTARRANLLTEGVHLPRARGALIAIGPVRLEVTGVTWPCRRMDEVHTGLLKALARDGRGGITTRVLEGGTITGGMAVDVLSRPQEHRPRLP
jgi:MOSC domain-containing protein YiiM